MTIFKNTENDAALKQFSSRTALARFAVVDLKLSDALTLQSLDRGRIKSNKLQH